MLILSHRYCSCSSLLQQMQLTLLRGLLPNGWARPGPEGCCLRPCVGGIPVLPPRLGNSLQQEGYQVLRLFYVLTVFLAELLDMHRLFRFDPSPILAEALPCLRRKHGRADDVGRLISAQTSILGRAGDPRGSRNRTQASGEFQPDVTRTCGSRKLVPTRRRWGNRSKRDGQ